MLSTVDWKYSKHNRRLVSTPALRGSRSSAPNVLCEVPAVRTETFFPHPPRRHRPGHAPQAHVSPSVKVGSRSVGHRRRLTGRPVICLVVGPPPVI